MLCWNTVGAVEAFDGEFDFIADFRGFVFELQHRHDALATAARDVDEDVGAVDGENFALLARARGSGVLTHFARCAAGDHFGLVDRPHGGFEFAGNFGVNVVDLYDLFIGSREQLYFATDTHWNVNGVTIALEETIEALTGAPPGRVMPREIDNK